MCYSMWLTAVRAVCRWSVVYRINGSRQQGAAVAGSWQQLGSRTQQQMDNSDNSLIRSSSSSSIASKTLTTIFSVIALFSETNSNLIFLLCWADVTLVYELHTSSGTVKRTGQRHRLRSLSLSLSLGTRQYRIRYCTQYRGAYEVRAPSAEISQKNILNWFADVEAGCAFRRTDKLRLSISWSVS